MGDAPRLAELLARGEPLTLETAEKAAAAGDGAVYDFFYRAADYAGLAVSAAINLLDPQAVILGGEMPDVKEPFYRHLREVIDRRVWNRRSIDIRVSHLGRSSAAIGAASLFIQQAFFSAVGPDAS